jgi:hypothetical protein
MRNRSFAIPSKRKYPIPDVAHARNALSRVMQRGTPAEKRAVKAAVKRKFPALAKRSNVIPTRTGTGLRIGQRRRRRSR